ncbi:MAG: hypothetical protein GY847_36615, partial [Proteobacteria bacterium]|nr:hypothetical protein [Pseudomonadota bacterium]
LRVFAVGHRVADHVLQKHFEHATRLLVDQSRDPLDAASARQTTDRWLGDPLDVVAQNLAVTFRAAFPKTFASLATARHIERLTRRSDKSMMRIRSKRLSALL